MRVATGLNGSITCAGEFAASSALSRVGEERPSFGVNADEIGGIEDDLAAEPGDRGPNVVSLFEADERTHVGLGRGRVAHHDAGQSIGQCLRHHVEERLGNDDATYGRALLAGFRRHFGDHGVTEALEFGGVGSRGRRQDGSVERVGFSRES